MFNLVILLIIVVLGGLLIWKARQPDGTFNWKTGLAGLMAIATGLIELVSHGISGLFN